nr:MULTISPECIES: sigma-70 family RNA polymerase sigma factor [unclassified Nocardia]
MGDKRRRGLEGQVDAYEDRFTQFRPRLRAMAYRMLGSPSEADDAVQEAWLRWRRADTASVDNLGGWLTTVVGRVCLDMLRARRSRREDPVGIDVPEPVGEHPMTPEEEAVLADSVGLALLVVLDTLAPAERLAFVLHDLFDLPYAEIGPIVGRSPNAAAQLAARARRRVRGADPRDPAAIGTQRRVVDRFLDAARGGDLAGLIEVLDPDVEVRADATAAPTGTPTVLRGRDAVAPAARAFGGRAARFTRLALVDGAVGAIVAPRGRLATVLAFHLAGDRIAEIDIIADPDRLRALDLAVFESN